MSTTTIDPLVIVRLNEQTDARGVPLGMVRGYKLGDALVPAVLLRHPVEKSEARHRRCTRAGVGIAQCRR